MAYLPMRPGDWPEMPDLFRLLLLSAIWVYFPTRWGVPVRPTDPLSDTPFAGLCYSAMLVYLPTLSGDWLVF